MTHPRPALTLGGATVAGKKGPNFEGLVVGVRQGLPTAALATVAGRYAFDTDAVADVLGFSKRTLARRRVAKRLAADESDRVARFARVCAEAESVLGDATRASDWLKRPNRALSGEAPFTRLDTDAGCRQVEAVLLRIAHGVFS